MAINVLGMKLEPSTIVIFLVIAVVLGISLCASCTSVTPALKEAFLGNLGSAPLNWRMGEGVPGDSWTAPPVNPTLADKSIYAPLAGNVGGQVPLPKNQLFMFYNNKFTPDCCYKPQQYSSSTGCACISPTQMKYISSRGGNNTLP
jgi:hypothetical protein